MIRYRSLLCIGVTILASLALYPIRAAMGLAHKAQRYANTPYHFSLEIPAGWKISPPAAQTLVVFTGARVHDFTPNCNVTASPVGNSTLIEFTNATRKRYGKVQVDQKAKTQNNRLVRVTKLSIYDEKATTLGGLPARSWRMQISLPNQPVIEERQMFCVKDKIGFGLTFATKVQDRKESDPIFDRLIASFRWDK